MANLRKTFMSDDNATPTSKVVVFGKEREMIHLHGYELKVFPSITLDNSDNARASVDLLLTADPDLPQGGGTGGAFAAMAARSMVIDFFRWQYKTNFTTSGSSSLLLHWVTGWHPCDLIVPALYLHKVQEDSGHSIAGLEWGITIEYSFVRLSEGDRAAHNLQWGRDILDSDDDASHAPARSVAT